jgi:hypothetical protein
MKYFLGFVCLFAFQNISAEPMGEIGLGASARTYPVGASVDLFGRTDFLLWDQREDGQFWKYGLIQARGNVASHGLVEGSLSFFPISFFEIGIAVSRTFRFIQPRIADCDLQLCKGIVDRQKIFSRLLLGAERTLVVLGFTQGQLAIDDRSRTVFDEVENLVANPGGERSDSWSLTLGQRGNRELYGLQLRNFSFLESDSKNEAQYLFYRKEADQGGAQSSSPSFVIGIGRYSSSLSAPEVSLIGNVLWTWGKSRSLY